jgi:type 1 glutamine amidotransferase
MSKALMVWGGWDGHEPRQCTERFEPFLRNNGFEVIVSDTLDPYADEEFMRSLDLVVQCWTMGRLTPEQERGLMHAVREGCGLAGWHGGLCDAFRGAIEYQMMTGGQFTAHPGGIIDYEVRVTVPDDPIMRGITDFRLKSEQYYMLVDPNLEILAETVFTGEHNPSIAGHVVPQVWKRMWGKGRVFYSALGHIATDFDVLEVRHIMERGILWAARR